MFLSVIYLVLSLPSVVLWVNILYMPSVMYTSAMCKHMLYCCYLVSCKNIHGWIYLRIPLKAYGTCVKSAYDYEFLHAQLTNFERSHRVSY